MRPPCDRNPEKSAPMIAQTSRIMEAGEAAGPGRKRQQFPMGRDFGEGQGDRLIEVGASDFLKERLRAEETKLRELRHALALASVPRSATPAPQVSLDQVLAVLRQIETVAAKSPARAREVLAGVIEPATLTPGPDGYEIALTLKNETAAIAGGRTLLSDGCGGRI